ncbi:SMI1/KNR4 family protein [Microbulbifer thermotolerans]|uniref:SMI1/KNR4 family protein n=1 Tax=Microbulbifer thermotolerans TaxID=252514 RepID=A0AB35I1C2_MICTH|nr:SMI1/KNR4 family protein [Microbulbifer thermotolerans]MCX2781310.1 SMI1/KNR4 family protein [Microbulbifer thermotolerans]MCX2803415.1 SMI1/KNR4 family protein [Microbulbifer thermotolerans]MCX2806692.1 SMI1/KNR4 family protein [Microbulbifer thermotolerans]MCX2842554.1 SMI1/KNR4 family protein [Microbulbifer thermotolerans]
MKESLGSLLTDFSLDEGASQETIANIKNISGIYFPDDYLDFLQDANGGEGFIGEEYLILWKAEELETFNREYEVEKYAPGIFLFGSNGGGEGFGFDTRSTPYKIVQVPFVGMDLQHANHVADSFTNLLERMNQSDGSLL